MWSWILVELKLDRSLVVFGEEGSAKRTIVWRTIGPNGKNPPKIRSKNLWNWFIILMPGTVLTNINYVITENGRYYLNLQSFAGKNSWNHFCCTYFQRILAFGNPLCGARLTYAHAMVRIARTLSTYLLVMASWLLTMLLLPVCLSISRRLLSTLFRA